MFIQHICVSVKEKLADSFAPQGVADLGRRNLALAGLVAFVWFYFSIFRFYCNGGGLGRVQSYVEK